MPIFHGLITNNFKDDDDLYSLRKKCLYKAHTINYII